MNRQLEKMIEKYERFITPQLVGEEYKRKQNSGEFPYISLRPQDFIEQYMLVMGKVINGSYGTSRRVKFVDVGCGIGSKLILANDLSLGVDLVGIEIETSYAEVARKLVPSADIRCQDAMTVDYSEFDVIYFYCPFRDLKKERALEEHIVNTAKSGAYILANAGVSLLPYPVHLYSSLEYVWDNNVNCWSSIWRKK